MPPRLGEVIKQARQARRLFMRRLAAQVMKAEATPISPQYLFDIEVHHRVPAPHILRELAWVLELYYDTLLALTGPVDPVVREYLKARPQHTEVVIKLFRTAQQPGVHDWDQLCRRVECGSKAAHHPVPAF